MKLADVQAILEQHGFQVTMHRLHPNYAYVIDAELVFNDEPENKSSITWHGAGDTEEEAVKGLLYWILAGLTRYARQSMQHPNYGFETLPPVEEAR